MSVTLTVSRHEVQRQQAVPSLFRLDIHQYTTTAGCGLKLTSEDLM